MPLGKLTEKQRRFADEYIRTGNITQSAIAAGYSTKTAYPIGRENLEKPTIKTYIDKRLEELRKESIADQDEILQYLTSVMRGNVEDEVLLVVPDGDFGADVERHEKRSDTMARTKAAELLGKRYMMWTEKVETQITGAVQFIDDIGSEDDGC